MIRRLTALALGLALVAAIASQAAHADGDPASDYLLAQKVFIPFDVHASQVDQQALLGTVQQATRQGFPIRVAVISSSYDLGAVTSLWRRPKLYARFLGEELKFAYKGRLLVVMPNGFGFNRPGHDVADETRLLESIPIGATPGSLARAAMSAVKRLAASSGIRVQATATVEPQSQQTTHDRIVLSLAVAVALALGAGFRLFIRARTRARAKGGA